MHFGQNSTNGIRTTYNGFNDSPWLKPCPLQAIGILLQYQIQLLSNINVYARMRSLLSCLLGIHLDFE